MPVSRFDVLERAIHDTASVVRSAEISRRAASIACNHAMGFLQRLSPYSTYPAAPQEGVRKQPHTPIRLGWRGPFVSESFDGGASGLIRNVSEHVGVQRDGLTDHSIAGTQAFWWPLKHSAGQGRLRVVPFTGNHTFGPWGGSDFVVRAASQARVGVRARVSTAGRRIAFERLSSAFRGD